MTGPISYRGNVWKCYALQFFVFMHFISGVLVPFYTDWGGLNFTKIMLLQSWFSVAMFLFEVPTGVVADRWGRKVSCALGALTTGIAALVYSSLPHFGLFFVAETLWALGATLLSGADQALLYDSLKADGREGESKQVLARKQSALLVALIVASPIGSAIAAVLGLRYAVMLMLVPQLVAVGIALSMREPPLVRQQESKRYFAIMREGLQLFATSRPLRRLTIDLVLGGFPAFMIIWTHQQRMRELGVCIVWFGLVQTLLAVAQIAVLNLLKRFERLAGSSRRYLVLSALLPALCYLAAALTDSLPLSLVLWTAVAGVGMTRATLIENYMHKHIDSAHRATAMSTASMCNRVVMAAVMPLIGLLVDQRVAHAFVLLGGLLLAASVYSALARHRLAD
ncbi:MAG: MFS transporter [Deltaproteobacteria bacterium]|nr:MFS transporter [Deltaproteobacteria bacterium]